MTVDDLRSDAEARSPEWYRTATRWTQLTFVEDDPLHFDADLWLQIMRESKSNALCLSAGGYIAFYPTRIPFHYRSRFLGDADIFGELVDGARRMGMSIMARVDPHAIHADAAAAHPEWLARDENGDPVEHWSFPDIWLTDVFSSYHREFITDVAREIVTDYDVDAVFANRWEGAGFISYSDASRRGFFDATGLELPRLSQPDDPAWSAYGAWRSHKLSELVVLWDEAVQAARPNARFIPNRGMLLTRDLDRDMVDNHYPAFFIDKQGRSAHEACWAAGRVGKRSRGMFPDRPVSLITSVGPEHHLHRWKDSVSAPEETRSWIVDGFAQGANPWFTKFNAAVPDTRWIEPVVSAFGLHEKTEHILAPLPFTSEVAVLDNIRIDRAQAHAAYLTTDPHEDGFYQAMLEARIPFEYISDQELSADRLTGVKVLVLPNSTSLSDQLCQVIRDFAASGGSVVAGFETSLRDENARPRRDFALADVLGVTLVAPARGPVKNNYIALSGSHAIAAGFDGANRIIGGTHTIDIEVADDVAVPFHFLPDFPDLPMEEVYPRSLEGSPAVVARQLPGRGRSVYLAFDIGAVFWEALQADHARLIANAIRWALGKTPFVTVEGPGLIDLAVRADTSSTAVTLVNLTNPMTMRGQLRETIPLRDQRVAVELPPGVTGTSAELLQAGEPVTAEVVDGCAVVELPPLELIETVLFTWIKEKSA